ncbi:helix-turn-helix domain-containing protein [Bacillus massilinigeriensis]|uniref:helix-turn-helix domain-containing protein n=1 Tax=Bacillus massilionigeriensis TaxID=1805475 RepID=UPI00096AEBCA|nr:helix-turn-helix transcriptional regulator [Bacillus massilionigeriensis]
MGNQNDCNQQYHLILKSAVKESGWSMREISRRCKKNGVSLSQPYLSKLCTGEVPPPSDKLNKVLGELLSTVSSVTKDELLVAAYIERIPKEVLQKLKEK